MATFTALIDANVLYRMAVTDLLLEVASTELQVVAAELEKVKGLI